ncbi:MAG: SDR family oxidoreductase, partial [Halobacteriales archaeon]|nr:SDR family oxidoreductase [Halobacteriales archaeon]
MDLDLDGHVALVTGSATGLGHACAEAFARQGANVALASPNLGDLAWASDRLFAIGDGEVFGLEADVRNPDQVEAFVREAVDQYGGLDHLVTGPRPLEPAALLDASDEDWFRGFDRLFMSVVWTLREAHPWLADSDHGSVVTVTNPLVRALAGEFSVANAFGRAVEGLAETQARAFAPDVRVNAVLPGPHDTEDLELFLTELVDAGRYADLDAAEAAVTAGAPAGGLGDPLDLGKLVAFLSSEHASYVNGATVPVDGGA